MRNTLLALSLSVALLPPLPAQTQTELKTPEYNPQRQAHEYRSWLAGSIMRDDLQEAAKALAELQKADNPSGLALETHGDFAFAAIDIGHRLLTAKKPHAAAHFFRAAEEALVQALAVTSDEQATEKAQYYEHLALICGRYLNKPDEARVAMEAAIRLQPEDQRLRRQRDKLDALNRDKAQFLEARNRGGAQ